MFYTNMSVITKTFHGVEFRPGETKEVSGIINDPQFVISSKRQEPPKREGRTQSKTEGSSVKAVKLTKAETSELDKSKNADNKEV